MNEDAMAQKTTEPTIQDRKLEVIRQPLAEPLSETELTHRLDELVTNIRSNGCDSLAKRLAQNIAAGEYGGRVQNVMNAFPQLMITNAEGKRGFSMQLDADGNKQIDGQELTATTLAAGKWLADHPGTTAKDVPLDQAFLTNFRTSMEMLQGPQATACSLPRRPVVPGKSASSEPNPGR